MVIQYPYYYSTAKVVCICYTTLNTDVDYLVIYQRKNLINYLKRTYNFMKLNQYWLLLENCYMHYMFFLMVLHWPIHTIFKRSCQMRELVNEKKYFYINSLKSITYIFWLYSTTLYWRSESNFQMKKEQSAYFLNQL